MIVLVRSGPSWDLLYAVASAQAAHFTTEQARAVGYSPQLLRKHVLARRVAHVSRSVYRLVHYPPCDHEELAVVWLWSARHGVFSHETALALHTLSDVLPARIHLSVPVAWSTRRLRVPTGVILHHADVPTHDRSWFGAVPATSASRTLDDCATSNLAPDTLRRAAHEAIARGLVARDQLGKIRRSLRPFGGLGRVTRRAGR